jgi:hypothetical protein
MFRSDSVKRPCLAVSEAFSQQINEGFMQYFDLEEVRELLRGKGVWLENYVSKFGNIM